jgi:hypothetical protein
MQIIARENLPCQISIVSAKWFMECMEMSCVHQVLLRTSMAENWNCPMAFSESLPYIVELKKICKI